MFSTLVITAKVVCVILLLLVLRSIYRTMVEVGLERQELINITTRINKKIMLSMLLKQPSEKDILDRCMSYGITQTMHELLSFCHENEVSLGYACFTLKRTSADDKIKYSVADNGIRLTLPNGTLDFQLEPPTA